MSVGYARVRNGKISPIRYTRQHLLFNKTLEMVISTGDLVIPLLSPAPNLTPEGVPTYRLPTLDEVNGRILSEEQLDSVLFRYHLGNEIAVLDEDGKLSNSQIPDTVVRYKGRWDPSSNVPELSNSTGMEGDVYMVIEGFEGGYTIDLGDGDIEVVSKGKMLFRDGKWTMADNSLLSEEDRAKLNNAMIAQPNLSYGGQGGSEQGAFSLVSYPSILEMLQGTNLIGQLSALNVVKEEIHLVDDGGITGLHFSPITGKITIDGAELLPGTFEPTFIIASSLSTSKPIPVRIDVLPYVLEKTTGDIVLSTSAVHVEQITSPQDPSPQLVVVDDGGLWNVSIDDGSKVSMDTSYVDIGFYYPTVRADTPKGLSQPLDIEVEVIIPQGQESPVWEKVNMPLGSVDKVDGANSAPVRMDMQAMDSIPIDSVI